MKSVKVLTTLLGVALATAQCLSLEKPSNETVLFELKSASKTTGSIHWSIANKSESAIYVFDFFLWGPALKIDAHDGQMVFDTTPTQLEKSCGPNRVAPVVLIVIGPGRILEGNFIDESLKNTKNKNVSMRIAVGSDPYSVVDEVRRLSASPRCDENPYNGIVRWGTIIHSETIPLS